MMNDKWSKPSTEIDPDKMPLAQRDENIGYHYIRWTWSVEDNPRMSAREKALGYERWAVKFDNVPNYLEPYEGWGASLAQLLRKIASHLRGDPIRPKINGEK